MKIGISTASFFNKVANEACFEVLRQLRVDTTEVFLNSFCEYEKSFVEGLAKNKGAIAVHSVHALGTQFEPELYNSNPRVRMDAETIFKKVCYAAYVLGAKFITFHGPLNINKNANPIDFVKFGERTNALIEIAASYGQRLSYETVHYTHFNNIEFFAKLSKQCPKLMATLDIKQCIQSEIDVFKLIDQFGDKISTVHVCDYYKDKTCLPGQGKFKFDKLISELEHSKIKAPVLLEVYSRDYKDLTQLKEALTYINSCLVRA